MSSVQLPVNPPVLPMLSKRVEDLPDAGDYIFEPKWDGFRTLIFRDHDEILIQSRDEKPLNRYFPELVGAASGAATRAMRARRRNRNRNQWRPRFRLAPAAAAPGSLAREDALPTNPGLRRLLRSALRGQPRCSRGAFRATTQAARIDARGCDPAAPFDPRHPATETSPQTGSPDSKERVLTA